MARSGTPDYEDGSVLQDQFTCVDIEGDLSCHAIGEAGFRHQLLDVGHLYRHEAR